MDLVISFLVYAVVLGVVVGIASIIPGLVYLKWKRKKLFLLLLLLCLSVEVVGIAHLANHPAVVCPEEYREFISEEEEQSIVGLNSGVYSRYIPFIPCCIQVRYADEESVVVETYYLLCGSTVMSISDDGPSYLQMLH